MNKFKYIILLSFIGASLLLFEDCDVSLTDVNTKVTLKGNFSQGFERKLLLLLLQSF